MLSLNYQAVGTTQGSKGTFKAGPIYSFLFCYAATVTQPQQKC